MIRFELSKRPNMAQQTSVHSTTTAARVEVAPRCRPGAPAGVGSPLALVAPRDDHDLDAAAAAARCRRPASPGGGRASASAAGLPTTMRLTLRCRAKASSASLTVSPASAIGLARPAPRPASWSAPDRARSAAVSGGLGRALHVGHDPLRLEPRRHAPRGPHQPVALRVRAARRRGSARPPARSARSRGRGGSPGRPRPRAPPCGAGPARAARAGCRGGRTCGAACGGPLGQVDLALGQALEQLLRREVDELDLVRAVQHAVGHRLRAR